MKILLDTHILLWWAAGDKRLSKVARRIIEKEENLIFVSAASFWELAIKKSLGRLEIDLEELRTVALEAGFMPISINIDQAIELLNLPLIHNDPFDRILLAQCLKNGLHLLSHDEQIRSYGVIVVPD